MAPSSPPPEAEGKRVSHRSRTSSVHVFDNAHAFADVDSDYGLRAKAGKWLGKQRKEFRAKRDTYTPLDWLACALPCISWIKTYSVRRRSLCVSVPARCAQTRFWPSALCALPCTASL